MSPILLLDTETTGLNPNIHEIVEIEARVLDDDLNVVDTFYRKIQPLRLDLAEKEAMNINGYKQEVWATESVTPMAAYKDLAAWLKTHCDRFPMSKGRPARAIVLGQNPGFDIAMIQQNAMRLAAIPIEFHYHQIDISI